MMGLALAFLIATFAVGFPFCAGEIQNLALYSNTNCSLILNIFFDTGTDIFNTDVKSLKVTGL